MGRGRPSHGLSWTASSLKIMAQIIIIPWQHRAAWEDFQEQWWSEASPRQVFRQGTAGASCIPSLQEEAEMPGMFLGAVMRQVIETPGFCYLPERVYGEKSSPGSHQHYLESC